MKSIAYHVSFPKTCNMCRTPVAEASIMGMRMNRSQGMRPLSRPGLAVSVCRCRTCGLVFPQPLMRPDDLLDHYGMVPDSYWNPAHFRPPAEEDLVTIETAKRLIGFEPGMRSLDIGAGIGRHMMAMELAGFEATGIEPSRPFHEKAVEFTGFSPQKLRMVTIEEAEFPADSFDFISMAAVLEHLYDPSEAIGKVVSWMKPSGVAFIEVPSSNHLIARLINALYKVLGQPFVTNLSPLHPPYHIYEFSLETFRIHGEKLGYHVAHHEFYVSKIYHLPKILHPILRRIMKRNETGMQLAIWIQKSPPA